MKRLSHAWRHRRHHDQIERYYRRLQKRQRNRHHDRRYLVPPVMVAHRCNDEDVFDCAEQAVADMLQRRPEVNDLDRRIPGLQETFRQTQQPRDGLISLLAQAPQAALAQAQMDDTHRKYFNKRERLFELIDFNDTIVDTVLAMKNEHRIQFADRVKQAADRICKRVGAPCFSNEQWQAIIRGLTREVAVYLAAHEHGFMVHMTDRTRDALGIDVQIMDPETQRYINIDVKTPSSFRYRLDELVREGRLSDRQRLQDDSRGYILEKNGRGVLRTEVVVLCILPDVYGEIADWRFVEPASICDMFNRLIRDHGLSDDKFGRE